MAEVLSSFEPSAPTAGSARTGEVHVWRVDLGQPERVVAELRRVLSDDEAGRADRFVFDEHRRRFTVARGALRSLLGGYLGRPAEEVEFEYGERGKPRLREGEVEFNLSHSGEMALLAVTVGVEVGVDVERLRGMEDALKISERFFSAVERGVLARCPAAARDAAFFRCWTRKEAYVKAVGDGIALGLDRFDVSLDEGEGTRFLALEGDARRAAEWSLIHVDPGEGYVGALAMPAHPRAMRGFEWRPGPR